MFRVVTNFDHWHSIYDSTDCSDRFKSAPLAAAGPTSFPTVTLATSPDGQRQFVLVLMADRLEDLWSLEALFRLRVGDQLENIFARDGTTRRRAVTALVEVAESVDNKQQAYRGTAPARSKSGPARMAAVALAGMAVGAAILVLVGGTGRNEVRLATKLHEQLLHAVAKSTGAAEEAATSLGEIEEIVALFRENSSELLADVKKEKTAAKGYAKAADDAWTKTKRIEERVLASGGRGPGTGGTEEGDVKKDPVVRVGPPTPVEDHVDAKKSLAADDRVWRIQERLRYLGYSSVGKVDGVLGKDTKTALLQWSDDEDSCPLLTRTSPDSAYISCGLNNLLGRPTNPGPLRDPATAPDE